MRYYDTSNYTTVLYFHQQITQQHLEHMHFHCDVTNKLMKIHTFTTKLLKALLKTITIIRWRVLKHLFKVDG